MSNSIRAVPAEPAASSPLWTRDLRLFAVARMVSLLGDGMLPVAIAAAMVGAGYSTAGVGYAMAAWMAPMAAFVLFGGALADRFTPRRMMVGADLVRVVVQVSMALVFLTGAHSLWLILGLQAVSGVAAAMFQPGVASVVPQVATDVQRANATLRVGEALTALLAPGLAGALVAFAGVGVVFCIDAATFAVSAGCLFALRLPPAAPRTGAQSMARDIAEGWREFTARRWLWSVIAIWAVLGLTAFGPLQPLNAGLIVATDGPTWYGIVMSAFGGGAIVGGLLGLRLRPERPLAAGAVALLAFVLCPLAPGVGLPVPLIAVCYAIGSAGFAFWGVMWSTTVQTTIPAAVLNRVYAYDVAGSIMVIPIGRALAGPAASLAGERPVLLVSTVMTLACVLLLLSLPAIRRVRRHDPTHGTADQP